MSEPMVLESWRRFNAYVIAPAAGRVRRGEMRLARFASAHRLLSHLAGAPDGRLLRLRVRQLLKESAAAIEEEARRLVEREGGGK